MAAWTRGTLARLTVGAVLATSLNSWAQPKTEEDKPVGGEVVQQAVAPIQARDVIERLKSVRSEILFEQEMTRYFDARRRRVESELAVTEVEAGRTKEGEGKKRRPLPVAALDMDRDFVVKAITLRPFKEAVVMYKGRVYTVRPGDKLGSIEVRDINEAGVVTAGETGATRAVMLGR